MRGLSKHHGGRPIHAFVNESEHHKTWNYLRMVPFIEHAERSGGAPFSILREMSQGYMHGKWATLEGCRDWKGFDYLLVANGHLEKGERIEDFLPEIETEYEYPLDLPSIDEDMKGRVLIYLSGTGPNLHFHNNTWTVLDWCAVVEWMNTQGFVPVIIGAPTPQDMNYFKTFAVAADTRSLKYESMVGKTTHEVVMAMICHARLWTGLNSGLGIVAASQRVPTVMFWSDNRYPHVRRGEALHWKMQTSWLSIEQLAKYRTVSYGDPELCPNQVTERILEVLA